MSFYLMSTKCLQFHKSRMEQLMVLLNLHLLQSHHLTSVKSDRSFNGLSQNLGDILYSLLLFICHMHVLAQLCSENTLKTCPQPGAIGCHSSPETAQQLSWFPFSSPGPSVQHNSNSGFKSLHLHDAFLRFINLLPPGKPSLHNSPTKS